MGRRILIWGLRFVAALLVMVLLGSILQSLFVQQAWSVAAGQAAGTGPVDIPMDHRLGWIAHDLVGLQPLYGVLTAIALLVAFIAAELVSRLIGLRVVVFAVAGAVAIYILFMALKMNLGTVGVFGARGTMGIAAQMAAGLIAGASFAVLTRRRA